MKFEMNQDSVTVKIIVACLSSNADHFEDVVRIALVNPKTSEMREFDINAIVEIADFTQGEEKKSGFALVAYVDDIESEIVGLTVQNEADA